MPALDEQEKQDDLHGLRGRPAPASIRSSTTTSTIACCVARRSGGFSSRALQAALFINLYRDEPALHMPFRFLRPPDGHRRGPSPTGVNRHALMVQRMIGRKVGTGGSSGHDYLRQTAEQHRVFADLFTLSTFFIPRSKLPPLPDEMRRALGYRYNGTQP